MNICTCMCICTCICIYRYNEHIHNIMLTMLTKLGIFWSFLRKPRQNCLAELSLKAHQNLVIARDILTGKYNRADNTRTSPASRSLFTSISLLSESHGPVLLRHPKWPWRRLSQGLLTRVSALAWAPETPLYWPTCSSCVVYHWGLCLPWHCGWLPAS